MSLGEMDMVWKNNHQFYQQNAERKQRWGIRKLSVGVASVLLGTTFMLYSNHAVLADTGDSGKTPSITTQVGNKDMVNEGTTSMPQTSGDSTATDKGQGKTLAEKPTGTDNQASDQDVTQQAPITGDGSHETDVPADGKPDASMGGKDKKVTSPNPNLTLVQKVQRNVTRTTDPTTEEASPSLPMSNQDIKLDSQPMLTDINNKPTDNWVYKNLKRYKDSSTAKVKEILLNHTTNDESGRYYFAGVANYNEPSHVIYLLARSNNLNDNDLYVTILHTVSKNTQEEVVAPGESKKVEYSGTSGTTHAPIFTNYDGTSVSIGLDGLEKGDDDYGMVVGFAYGYDTGISGDQASMGKFFMATPMPTKTTTTIHYVDQATGDELAVPKSFEGVAYQKYTITGEAPTIDGYTLKQSPKTTTGYISPYKVGESYDFRLDKHVVIKQTVIDSQGLIRVTAYYDGEAINNTTRYLGNIPNVNDYMSFMSHGESYAYINQITSTNDGIVYYYAKDGSEDKSEVRVHYIDVTGNKNSIFVPGDGEEVATDKISGKLGESYNYNVNLPTDYNLATNQANTVNGTYTIDHHDEYVYVVKKTSANKEAAKKAIEQAAQTKDDAIDKSNLTDEEKAALKQKVSDAANEAKGKIDTATKDADVKTAQSTGEQAINNVNVPDTSANKDDANKDNLPSGSQATDNNDSTNGSNSTTSTQPTVNPSVEDTITKILMHAAYLYDNQGVRIQKPFIKAYIAVVVDKTPVVINGIKYYKVAGKDEYIKAGNIDGTLRVITHNSYIYNNKGKATRSKGIKRLVKKTRIVRTYGAPINIKGHMMYRIGKNRYIKARNFAGTLRVLSHNSFVYDENGNATRNKGVRHLLKKSRVVRTFDAPVKINRHMMYRVDNGYVKVKNFK